MTVIYFNDAQYFTSHLWFQDLSKFMQILAARAQDKIMALTYFYSVT